VIYIWVLSYSNPKISLSNINTRIVHKGIVERKLYIRKNSWMVGFFFFFFFILFFFLMMGNLNKAETHPYRINLRPVQRTLISFLTAK
jgi:hypothetical protein